MRALPLFLLALIALPASALELRSISFQGIERHYYLSDPGGAEPQPVFLFLHGFRSPERAVEGREDPEVMLYAEDIDMAAREGLMLLAPLAWQGQWNLFDQLAEADWARPKITLPDGDQIDDIAFIEMLLDTLIAKGRADPDRVYLSGQSDGAIFTWRLVCQRSERFAAAVPTMGSMHQSAFEACAPARPVPILSMAGTLDRSLPYDGWIFKQTGREVSIPEAVELMRRLHGCTRQTGEFLPDLDPEDGSQVRRIEYTGCARDGAVVHLRLEGSGHSRPGGPPRSAAEREKWGARNRDIDVAELMWEFFSRWPEEQ